MRVPLVATLAAILAAALALRLHGYALDPAPGASWDGVEWAWNGQSLWLHHTTAGWSYLPSYSHVVAVRVEGRTYLPGVSPYFDHPPLFGLLVGGIALLAGQSTPDTLTEPVIRLVPIALSLVTILLSFALVRQLCGRTAPALITVLLLALSPAMVLTARLVESEALLAPLLVGALLLVLQLRSGQSGRWRLPLLVGLCAAAPLVKEPGVVVGLICAAILLFSARPRTAVLPLLGTALGVAIYLGFAAAIDWPTFLRTVMTEAGRRRSVLDALRQYFTSTHAGLGGFVPLVDPLWYAGWAALGVLAIIDHRLWPLALAAVLYAATIAMLGDARVMVWNGWYRIPDEPLLYAAAGIAASAVALTMGQRTVAHHIVMHRSR